MLDLALIVCMLEGFAALLQLVVRQHLERQPLLQLLQLHLIIGTKLNIRLRALCPV